MNVLLGYVVGVIEVLSWIHAKIDFLGTPCEALTEDIMAGELFFWLQTTLSTQVLAVILDKVYDLTDFAPFLWGAQNKIESACFSDVKRRCKFY
jgi:hypothetical protein